MNIYSISISILREYKRFKVWDKLKRNFKVNLLNVMSFRRYKWDNKYNQNKCYNNKTSFKRIFGFSFRSVNKPNWFEKSHQEDGWLAVRGSLWKGGGAGRGPILQIINTRHILIYEGKSNIENHLITDGKRALSYQ